MAAKVHVVGTLIFPYQLLDSAGPTDLLDAARGTYMKALRKYGPVDEEAIARAPEFAFHYIGVDASPVTLGTSNLTILPTVTARECPDLDILIVPGPYLGDAESGFFQLHTDFVDLIRKHVAAGRMLWNTCTGASLTASTGVLDGKRATVNNVEYPWVSKRWPKVNWTREKKWIIDGNIWSGSGAMAATDMAGYWLKENFGLGVLTHTSLTIDYEPRDADGLYTVLPQRYDEQGNKLSTHVFHYYDDESVYEEK